MKSVLSFFLFIVLMFGTPFRLWAQEGERVLAAEAAVCQAPGGAAEKKLPYLYAVYQQQGDTCPYIPWGTLCESEGIRC